MNENQGLGWHGTFTLELKRGGEVVKNPVTGKYQVIGGEVIDRRVIKNALLNTGRTYLIQRIMDDTASVVSGTAAQCVYVGTTVSAGAAAAGDTTAQTTEVARETFTYATGALGACSATATFVSATANGALTEAGIFAGATTSGDGVFIARTLFAAINKTTSDTLTVHYNVSFTGT